MKEIKRGAIIYLDLGIHPNSSIQSGIRPCVVVSNNKNNRQSKVLSVCPCTTKIDKGNVPTHISLNTLQVKGRFDKDSTILVEQITTVDKRKVISIMGQVDPKTDVMKLVERALLLQLGIKNRCVKK